MQLENGDNADNVLVVCALDSAKYGLSSIWHWANRWPFYEVWAIAQEQASTCFGSHITVHISEKEKTGYVT